MHEVDMPSVFIGAIMMQMEAMTALTEALQETNRILAEASGTDIPIHHSKSPELSVIHGGEFPDDLESFVDYDPDDA